MRAGLYSALLVLSSLSQIKEIKQAKHNEIVWHFFGHTMAVFSVLSSFFYHKNPKLYESIYYIQGFVRAMSLIFLRYNQIKNGSYIMINPTYMIPLGIAAYIVATTSTAYFSLSSIAILLVFQLNFALCILYVNNELLGVKTFLAEYLTVTVLLNVAIFSARYDYSRREIELFLLNKKIATERSFFRATLTNLPLSIMLLE